MLAGRQRPAPARADAAAEPQAQEIGTGIRDSPDALRAAGRHCQ
jgi:hypothetical protein